MIINQDGTVTIKNNDTGEQRTVNPVELGSYSPLLANQYYAYMAAQKSLDKSSGSGTGATDTLTPPDNSVIQGGGATSDTSQNVPDLQTLYTQYGGTAPTLQQKISSLKFSKTNPSQTNSSSAELAPIQPKPQQPVFSINPNAPKIDSNNPINKLPINL